MAQSPSWEANWFAASQEIPHISRKPKVHYRTHKRPPPVCAHIYILFKKSKIYIKIFKTLLHVSITRSSSGSIYCSLLKLKFKTFSELLRYVNLVLWQHAATAQRFECFNVNFRLLKYYIYIYMHVLVCVIKQSTEYTMKWLKKSS